MTTTRTCLLGAWTDLPAGRSTMLVDGTPYETIRDLKGWYVYDFPKAGEPNLVCRVTRGAEFWAGPDADWNVPNDIRETLRIVLQGGYDCGCVLGGANCHGCPKSGNQAHS